MRAATLFLAAAGALQLVWGIPAAARAGTVQGEAFAEGATEPLGISKGASRSSSNS